MPFAFAGGMNSAAYRHYHLPAHCGQWLFRGGRNCHYCRAQGRLEQLADEGNRAARQALELAKDPNRYLPTVQFGITLVNTFVAAFGGEELVNPLAELIEKTPIDFIAHHSHSISLVIVVVCITFFSLLLGELVPKQLALRQAERLGGVVAPVLTWISILLRPLVWLMGKASDAVLFLLRANKPLEPSVSLDDIEHLIETGTEEGVLETVEQRVAMEALRLGERTVRDVCARASISMRST